MEVYSCIPDDYNRKRKMTTEPDENERVTSYPIEMHEDNKEHGSYGSIREEYFFSFILHSSIFTSFLCIFKIIS